MSNKTVKTCVFPVAGRGTRFLPVTKASPKEMLPIVDKPLIQYAVDEALSAGAETLVFITGSSKRAIEDHFDSNPELEAVLQQQGKQELLELLNGILPSWASCVYIRQPAPLGLGHAVLCARPVVGDAPFMVHLADDLIDAKVPCLKQMADVHANYGGSVLGVQNVPRAGHRQIRHRDAREVHRAAHRQDVAHRREAEARQGGVHARGGRPLSAVAVAVRRPREDRQGRGRRDSAHRRHRAAHAARARLCVRVRGQALRLRQQARVSAGDRGVRPEAPEPRQGVRRAT